MSGSWEILDLTQPMDETLAPYTEIDDSGAEYSDPQFQMADWCSIAERGYSCSKLTLGTQTGTHIDAPSHFAEHGASLDALPLSALMGPYHFIELDAIHDEGIPHNQNSATILFLTAKTDAAEISAAHFEALLNFDCLVWVIVCGIRVTGENHLYMHQVLADRGHFLVEDLETTAARQVRAGGEIIMLPMHLTGAVGAPCRVIVRWERGAS